MEPDIWQLYRQMMRSRLFEEAVAELYAEGLISGEMHMGIGEEGIAAGVLNHLLDGDALALDHRASPQVIIRGVDPLLVLKELLGRSDGLCAGMGGHMHLFSREHLLATSGIVGSSGPAGSGFALAAQYAGSDKIAVSFFGEGAINQGMMMEALNLAVTWKLPQIFVCKDNGWAITTRSEQSMGGNIAKRAGSFGMPAVEVDGSDAVAVWNAAQQLITDARNGKGPAFIHATCARPDGHMLGDLMLRIAHRKETPRVGSLLRSTAGKGNSVRGRLQSVGEITTMLRQAANDHMFTDNDPLQVTRRKLEKDGQRLFNLEAEVQDEMTAVVREALDAGITTGGLGV